MKTLVVLSVLAFLLLARPAASHITDDKRIVPGKRIGKWTLEVIITDLERTRGPASRIRLKKDIAPAADVLLSDLTMFVWAGVPVRAATVDQKTIISLFLGAGGYGAATPPGGYGIDWHLYKTDRGIGLESTRDKVVKAYGKPTAETTPRRGETRLIYDKIGIAFRFYTDGSMRGLLVFRPGKSNLKF